jgi:hypothetical protein
LAAGRQLGDVLLEAHQGVAAAFSSAVRADIAAAVAAQRIL